MDCFGSLSQIWYAQKLLCLTRRRRADAGSCGFAIRHRVMSARLRPASVAVPVAGFSPGGTFHYGTQFKTPPAKLQGLRDRWAQYYPRKAEDKKTDACAKDRPPS
jgi:hypothetical protein